jgi:amino acid adenylation domain-containing protein
MGTDNIPQMTVLRLIVSRAEEHPTTDALVHGDRCVTYSELDSWSTALALRLRDAGVGVNDAVGIYFDSSVEIVVAALGVWKAGGAYLPIDPAYPADRAASILLDSGASILITQRSLASALPAAAGWMTLFVDDVSVNEPIKPVSFASASPDDLAYIIYTSGSTGQPKGVEITHRNLLNLVEWHTREFSISCNDRATQIAGPGFDAAVWELWPYLTKGAAVYLPSREARLSAVQLRDWLVAEKITVSFVPTVLTEEILRLPWPANTSLRTLLTGGDALHSFPPDDIPFKVVNNYGPTECTVVATSAVVNAPRADESAPAIGRPILNTSIYLLDEAGREVEDGEVGEIYIGGASVGRGYRNRADLTAASFVTINVAGRMERTFRTGDLAKRLPDGELAFLGRADDQIKIRGFRIEPGEIASVINRHPLVVSSAVIARNGDGDKRLVAYIVPASGAEIWERDLRELLIRHLPDYMVPSSFVLLDRIPVNANGKLDKTALPAPTETNQLQREGYVAPRNDLERIVEGIVGPILNMERVSIHENFFLLGGHSLMGAQVIARVRDIFDAELSLGDVFRYATVAKLAVEIEKVLEKRVEAMTDEEVLRALHPHTVSGNLAPSDSAIDNPTFTKG